ncbi:MAG: Ig-like domain-containing protein [Phenylobacterium sp.]|uniref:Ig-like domain-containing protein n=1 Tax=Phenylobacterium sp. TaxID=1871053 RepID=UPI002731298E|nr:VCBS domain-containing protein [Phenylobacterium sp.]MDP2008537.1 Ig-like domain-containing protein [Phenylobacterium sp.]
MPTPVNSPSTNNTPQAKDDLFTGTENGTVILDVMANDLGGKAKQLYSLDQTTPSTVAVTATSAMGATITIVGDKIGYAANSATFEALGAGQVATDTFSYVIKLGNGALSVATVSVNVTGTNDAPVVSGTVIGAATEGAGTSMLNAMANASDVDAGTTLSIVGVPAGLPAGVTYDAATQAFALDTNNSAYNHLAAGVHQTVSVGYGVSDGIATTGASVSWDLTGTNDAPVVSGAVNGAAIEGGPAITLNALANASDVDDGAILNVSGIGALPPGVSYDAATRSFTLNPADPAYASLNAGQTQVVSVSYSVTDGAATTPASVSWSVAGVSNATANHVVTFDAGGAVSAGYEGFNWVGHGSSYTSDGPHVTFYPYDWDQNGSDREAYNGYGPKIMDITRSTGEDFDLVSLDMADGAYKGYFSQANEVDLLGFDDGVLVYSTHVTLSDTAMTNYVLNYNSIDKFQIVITGGSYSGGTGWYSIDNFATNY